MESPLKQLDGERQGAAFAATISSSYSASESIESTASMDYYVAEDWEQYSKKDDTIFCEDCMWTFPEWGQHLEDSNYNWYRYSTDLDRVQNASLVGCPFCSILWMAISYKIGEGHASDPSVGILLERRGTGWGVFFNAGEHEEWRSAVNFVPAKDLDPGRLPKEHSA